MTAIERGERMPVAQQGVLYCSNCESEFGLEPLLYCPFTIHWPGGKRQLLKDPTPGQLLKIEEATA